MFLVADYWLIGSCRVRLFLTEYSFFLLVSKGKLLIFFHSQRESRTCLSTHSHSATHSKQPLQRRSLTTWVFTSSNKNINKQWDTWKAQVGNVNTCEYSVVHCVARTKPSTAAVCASVRSRHYYCRHNQNTVKANQYFLDVCFFIFLPLYILFYSYRHQNAICSCVVADLIE